jgi:zinc D-Ala-D-Ala carboxypeptidase
MLIELMTLAAVLLLLSKKRGTCSGQPGVYFTWAELSTTKAPFANNPSGPICTNLKRLTTEILDPLRELTGAPIYVTSAFRSPMVNRIAGGVSNSLHLQGLAADIYSRKYNPGELKALMIQKRFPYGELIVYQDHLHVSL